MYTNIFVTLDEFPALVVIKPKRERYALFEKNTNSLEDVKGFIDEIIGGSQNFKAMNDSLEFNIFNEDL